MYVEKFGIPIFSCYGNLSRRVLEYHPYCWSTFPEFPQGGPHGYWD